MNGVDRDFTGSWNLDRGRLTRTPSVGLRNRESFNALVTVFAQRAGAGGFTMVLNDDEYDHADITALGDLNPLRITVLHLLANDSALEVRLDTRAGGHTYARAPDEDGYPEEGALRRLAAVVEAHKRRLGPGLILTRPGWRWLDRLGPSVVAVRGWGRR